jgi:hypothetical protein
LRLELRIPNGRYRILDSVGSGVTDQQALVHEKSLTRKCLAGLITRIREYPARYSLILKLRE